MFVVTYYLKGESGSLCKSFETRQEAVAFKMALMESDDCEGVWLSEN